MSKLAALGGGTGVTVGAGAAVLGAVAVAAYVSGVFSPGEAPTQAASLPAVQTQEPQQPAPAVAAQPEEISAAPKFDVVRVETDGAAMVAGSAEAGSTVAIKLDDEVVAEVKADASGQFAGFVSLPESSAPRVLTLDAGTSGQGSEQVIVAPIAAPAPKAVAEPAPQAEAVQEPQPGDVAAAEPVLSAPPVTPALQKPAVLLATKDGVRVLQAPDAPQPEAMTSLLSSISYDAAGDVALTGQGGANFVRVYLDNKPITTSQIAADGNWEAALPSVDTGIYTLRVDALDADGTVVERVETPFKREASEVLSAATQPEKPVQAITVQPGATLWAIARERYGDGTLYTRVVAANADAIRDPDLIYPGQVFTVPN